MKRGKILTAFLLVLSLLLSACSDTNQTETTEPATGGSETATEATSVTEPVPSETSQPIEVPEVKLQVYKEVGRFLKLNALAEPHSVLVDNSGMSGSEGRNQVHSNDAETMYVGSDSEFVFDIGHIERLGEVYFWNYNVAGATENGLQNIVVDISLDGTNYSETYPLTLTEATGESKLYAHGLEDRDTIDFNGASGRYLRIRAESNYGGSENGLSEIRLYRYRQPNFENQYLSLAPIERFNNGQWSATPEDYLLVNGTGLDSPTSAEALHDNNPDHMFLGSSRLFDLYIDLQGQYPISEITIWNYNNPANLEAGLKNFRLYYSHDMTRWESIGQYELPIGDGSEAMPPSLVIPVDNLSAHYLRLEIRSNHGGDGIGLSEIAVRSGTGWYSDPAPDYTALLSNYSGWTGADGIYTVNLDGKDSGDFSSEEEKTFFVFSDTITGEVDGATDLRSGTGFVNNTFAKLEGRLPRADKIEFYLPENSTAQIIPNPPEPATKAGKEIYYWLGDTFVQDSYLYVFALRIDSVNTSYGFEQNGVDLARYEIVDGEVDLTSLTIIHDDAKRLNDISNPQSKFYFGGAVYQNLESAGAMNPDGYIYIYGYNDLANNGRQLVVARVLPENLEDFSAWEYLSASEEWSQAIPEEFLLLHADVAPEVSVSEIHSGPQAGKYLLVWQNITVSSTIKAAVAETPWSVFTDDIIVMTHDTTIKIVGQANTTYNAKAHPALSSPGELLITYNINGGMDAFEYGDIYRPRFIRLSTLVPQTERVVE